MKPPFQIKICGVTNRHDALLVAQAGADAIGLNFYDQSSRYVDLDAALEISQSLPAHIRRVGVFVNAPIMRINEAVATVGLDFVQLHGDETVEDVCAIDAAPVLRAFRYPQHTLTDIHAWVLQCQSQKGRLVAILLDASVPGQYGGTGTRADWHAAARIRQSVPVPMILAGGLDPHNIMDAVRAVEPAGVDVASGVEAAPGIKHGQAVHDFVARAREGLEQTGI